MACVRRVASVSVLSAIPQPLDLNRDRQSMPHFDEKNFSVADLTHQEQQKHDRLLQREVPQAGSVPIALLGLHFQSGDSSRQWLQYWLATEDAQFFDSSEINVLKQLDKLLFFFREIRFPNKLRHDKSAA
jgi:hypothetical protein